MNNNNDWQFSAEECEDCGKAIPLARRKALPGVQLCVNCAASAERQRNEYRGCRYVCATRTCKARSFR